MSSGEGVKGRVVRSGLTGEDIAILGEQEALQRLELLSSTGRVLDIALDDYDGALDQVAEVCVAEFADLCAIEVVDPDGEVHAAAYRHTTTSGLHLPDEWVPIGKIVATDRRPVLGFRGGEEAQTTQQIRERLSAQSLMVVPITAGGLTLGWFVAATGAYRRGFRPSALRIGSEMSRRLGTAIQRVMLHREMQASVRDQSRTVRRLRRLATAATNLAGAATTESVLNLACVEACVIQEADGAIARWSLTDGTVVQGKAGQINSELATVAFAAVATNRRASRGRGWVAYPLPNTDPWQEAALVVLVGDEFSAEEELVLSSLASLIPVAFERALGTETAIAHEARLRAVVDASPVALMGIEPDGSVTLANRAAQDLFDLGPNPRTWALNGLVRSAVTELCAEVLQSESVVNQSFSTHGLELSLSGAPVPAASPEDHSFTLVAGVDLTDMRHAERALVQAQRLDAMGQVAGRVAHDFNNLLTLIVGYAEILRRGNLDKRQASMVDNIEKASKRAAGLTQQMLDMTRQKTDSGVVIDLGQEVSGLDAVLARMAGARVDLRIRASHNVIKVRLDPSEMEQIVVNLVINACDAMEASGQVDVSVELAAPPLSERRVLDLPPGPLALLSVSDNGPGMSAEVQARCLEPFFTTKDRGEGSGLGLATVYGLVRERGGQLQIDSELGRGTTIRIWLPVARNATLSPTGEISETWPPDRRISGRILLVEDDDDLRPMAERILASTGLTLVVASSAEEALVIIGTDGHFDALVTDIILPGLSGVELVNEVRRTNPDVPVLYMTGYSGGPGAGGPDSGDQVLRKPYRPDVLRLRVAELVELSVLQRKTVERKTPARAKRG